MKKSPIRKFNAAFLTFLMMILSQLSLAIIPFGFFKKKGPINCAIGSPSVGALCTGGTYFLGTLSPGATSGSGTDSYMTTPGGCGDIPVGSVSGGTGFSSYTLSDFTPTCSGTDSLTKSWNDGSGNYYDILSLINYAATSGVGSGAINKDQNHGDTNTNNITAITTAANGGYHAAARYCDKLSFGGYTDWYLPNRYELNLMSTNATSIPGLEKTGSYYHSSTEFNGDSLWVQRLTDGAQSTVYKNTSIRVRCVRRIDPCAEGIPTPGTICKGGTIYLGTLSPGAISGSGTDRYMTTPGGCGQIPAGSISGGSGNSAYALADFNPTCAGTDSLTKYGNDGSTSWYDFPTLTNYTTNIGTGYGATNTDQFYGDSNTMNIVAITASASGGYHAAARYCDKLNYGGYTDWYLPNRYELNLMSTNAASIPGLDTSGNWYWSSTEYADNYQTGSWVQKFNDGSQANGFCFSSYLVRCVRRF